MLKYLTVHVPDGFTTNFVRYPIATILYLPLLFITFRQGKRLGSFWYWALIPAGVNIIAQTLFAICPYYMSAGLMAFLLRFSTVWSILGAFWLFPDERSLARTFQFWIGALLAAGGFVRMCIISNSSEHIGRDGIVIVLICTIFWGLYDITVRYTMRDIHPLVVFGVIGNYTSIGLILLAPLGHPESVLTIDLKSALVLIVSAYIGIAMAYGMYYVAIQRLGVAVSSIAMMLTPFVTILGSSIVLHERFTISQWIAAMTLITGATLVLWSRYRMRRPPPVPLGISPD